MASFTGPYLLGQPAAFSSLEGTVFTFEKGMHTSSQALYIDYKHVMSST